jgi:K+-sensing histidine kinase KdpD
MFGVASKEEVIGKFPFDFSPEFQPDGISGIIHSTSNNTYRLLENLLDWVRMQQGNMSFNKKSLILRELVLDVVELVTERVRKKRISLVNSIEDEFIIHADSNMIKTVIRNLMSNAIKFTASEGD